MITERTSPNEKFEYGYPHSNAILQFHFKMMLQAACHPMICDVINDVKPFQTVYHRIYCRNFLMLSSQKSIALQKQVH